MSSLETAIDFAAIRKIAEHHVAAQNTASVVVAIGGRDGDPEYVAAGQLELGSGASASAGPDTLYRIYSMTKPVTGCAIMMLIEDGKLTLDTPVADIFPQYAQQEVLTDPQNSVATRPAANPTLIRHLLTHTAGYGYAHSVPALLKPVYVDGGGETARASLEEEAKRPPNLIAFAEAAARLPLMFDPGTNWHYSLSLDIAGAVVEKLSGMAFEDFLEQRLFAPLGMADTSFTVPASKLDRLVSHYEKGADGLELVETGLGSMWARPPRFPVGGSGLVSSARDYSRFMAMLLHEGELDGVRVLNTETARAMMTDMTAPGVIEPTITEGSVNQDPAHGAGGRVVMADKPGGEAEGTFGWSGAAATHAFVDRKSGLYVVIMAQALGWMPNTLHGEVTSAVYAGAAGG